MRVAGRNRWIVGAASVALFAGHHAYAQNVTTAYQYDALGRVTTAQDTSGSQVTYAYDAAGNRTLVNGQHVLLAADFNLTTLPNQAKTFSPTLNAATSEHIFNVGPPSHGVSASNGDGSITYTPSGGYVGLDAFTYTIKDASDAQGVGHVHIIVNTPPTASAYSFEMAQGGSNSFSPPASDPDGQSLTITTSTPAHGTATVVDGKIVYVPAPSYIGPDTFNYTVTDPLNAQATNTVTVRIVGPPIANTDNVSTAQGQAITFDPRSNDIDANGFPIIVTAANGGAHGSVSYTPTSITYTPSNTGGYVGPDSFTYTIANDRQATATGVVNVSIVNSPPVANDDAYSVPHYSSVNRGPNQFYVLANDSDPGGDPLTVVAVSTPANGRAGYLADSVVYTPASGFMGVDTLTYTVSDNHGGTSTATISVTTTNTPPSFPDFNVVAYQNAYSTNTPIPHDADGDATSTDIYSQPSHGTVTSFYDPSYLQQAFTYTPVTGYHGPDEYQVRARDGFGGVTIATAHVTVINSPPTAVDDSIVTIQNTATTFNPLANDSDREGDPLTVVSVSQAAHGSVSINNGSSVSYSPYPGYVGADSFTYTVSDGPGGNTSSANVSVNVQPPGSLTISQNRTNWNSVVTNSGTTSDPAVVATVAANSGVGPYSYSWQYLSGDTSTNVVASGNSATWLRPGSTVIVGTFTSTWRAMVTDSYGVIGYGPTITVSITKDKEGCLKC